MTQPIFVDLESNGGHVRIDPPPPNSGRYIKLMIVVPRQFSDDGAVSEDAQIMSLYISKKAAEAFRDGLSVAIDEKIQQLVGM